MSYNERSSQRRSPVTLMTSKTLSGRSKMTNQSVLYNWDPVDSNANSNANKQQFRRSLIFESFGCQCVFLDNIQILSSPLPFVHLYLKYMSLNYFIFTTTTATTTKTTKTTKTTQTMQTVMVIPTQGSCNNIYPPKSPPKVL